LQSWIDLPFSFEYLLFLSLPRKEKEAKRKVTAARNFAKTYVAITAAQSEPFGKN